MTPTRTPSSAVPGPVVADSGVLFLGVTHSYAETPNPDIVLVPGSGPRTATMMADKQLTGWLRQVHETTRWTTSVCTGAMILAAAGVSAASIAWRRALNELRKRRGLS